MKRNRLVLAALILVTLLVLDLASYFVFDSQREAAFDACLNTKRCEQLAAKITTLQSKPFLAAAQEQQAGELSRQIESFARASGINGDDLASIEPEPKIRVGDTAYLEEPTTITLRQVTLTQLASFLAKFSAADSGVNVKAIRLSIPPRKDDASHWSAEVTLTSLVYMPLPSGKGA